MRAKKRNLRRKNRERKISRGHSLPLVRLSGQLPACASVDFESSKNPFRMRFSHGVVHQKWKLHENVSAAEKICRGANGSRQKNWSKTKGDQCPATLREQFPLHHRGKKRIVWCGTAITSGSHARVYFATLFGPWVRARETRLYHRQATETPCTRLSQKNLTTEP